MHQYQGTFELQQTGNGRWESTARQLTPIKSTPLDTFEPFSASSRGGDKAGIGPAQVSRWRGTV